MKKQPKTTHEEQTPFLSDFNLKLKKSQKMQDATMVVPMAMVVGGFTVPPIKSESRIQAECVAHYRNTYCLKHHNPSCMILSIPNEGRGAASSQLINTGLYPGCADLFVIHKKRVGAFMAIKLFFIEIKTPENRTGPKKNGQSQKQIDFEEHCKQMGIPYFIVRSLEEFCQIIEKL